MAVVAIAASATLLASLYLWPIDQAIEGPIGGFPGLAFWIALTLLATAAPVHVPRGPFVSVYMAPIVAVAVLGGPAAAAIVAVLGTFEVRELRRQVSPGYSQASPAPYSSESSCPGLKSLGQSRRVAGQDSDLHGDIDVAACRTHLSLGKDSLNARELQGPELGEVVAIPQVGGLHHRYEHRAA